MRALRRRGRMRRLIVVCQADPSERYDWIPPPQTGDRIVALDAIAHRDLAARQPILFDELENWEERSTAQHHIAELLSAIKSHPAIATLGHDGHPLIDFAELRLQLELARLLRGWTLARADSEAGELVFDPTAPSALVIGARAAFGEDPTTVAYNLPPEIPGSRILRTLAHPVMQSIAAVSRVDGIRIAVVAAGKLSLALAALPAAELREMRVGAMPFPGLDHGNGALLALRRRLPLLATYGARRHASACASPSIPDHLHLDESEELDRAMTLLVRRLLVAAACEHEQAVAALARLERASALRALVLPSAAIGAARLLIDWAHKRGLNVAAMQHGIYAFQEFDGGDRLADVIFTWGPGTAEQIHAWPEPRPDVWPVGAPGTTSLPPRPIAARLRRALITTSSTVDVPIAPISFCETFIDVLTPGLQRLIAAGVKVELRPHPHEDAERYRHLLRACSLDVHVVADGPFSVSASAADIVFSSVSSVAFEAAALGLPVLLWLGGTPQWVRCRHLVPPWTEHLPGMFQVAADFTGLVDDLLDHPQEAFEVARRLARVLSRYAEPFEAERFAGGLRALLG